MLILPQKKTLFAINCKLFYFFFFTVVLMLFSAYYNIVLDLFFLSTVLSDLILVALWLDILELVVNRLMYMDKSLEFVFLNI